jgi:hypothetical protein
VNELELTIGPTWFTYPAAGCGAVPRYGSSYEYTADCFDRVAGSLLFWGPYLDLAAGVYLLDFVGAVDGRLSLEFVHDSGRMRIKRIELDDFRMPACVVLVEAVNGFEMRALKTRALQRLTLDGVRLQCVYPGAESR